MDRGRGRRGGATGRGQQPTGRGGVGGQSSSSIGRGAGGRGQQPVNSPGGQVRGSNAPSPAAVPSYRPAPATSALSQEMGRMTIGSSSSQDPPAASPPTQLPPLSSKGVRNPPRRGYGTLGKKIIVKANHFLVEIADIDLHHYDISITPEVLSKKVCRDIMAELVASFSISHLGKRKLAYDGRKSAYTAGELPFLSKDFAVKLVDKDGGRRERDFKVSIKFAAKADLHHLREFLLNRQPDAPYETLQALDVVLREKASTAYEPVGRSFFDPIFTKGELGNGLEYWKGFYQSLRPTQMGLSLNIDMSARAFFEPIKVTDFVMKYFSRDISRPLSDQDRIKLKRVLRGLKVEVNHSKNMRRYKVSGVSAEPIQRLMFSLAESEEKTSVVQYFKDTYKITLKYPFLPALQAGSDSKPIYLPMELCKIVEGQRYSKKLNERQVTALLKATCQRPKDREGTISQMVRKNNYNNDELVNTEFGMHISPELTSIEARVLDPPMLLYHASGQESRVAPRVGQWNMINKKMVNGGKVDFWTCIDFSRNTDADTFIDRLLGMCINKGMVFNPDPLVPFHRAPSNQIEKALRALHADTCSALSKMKSERKLQLLIVILPDMTGSYGTIKRVCETELGIVSQCCQPRQAQKLSVQYMENVALKINVKVGGRNTVLEQAHLRTTVPLFRYSIAKARDGTTTNVIIPTIIFGADVTHPASGEDSSPSIAAVVASMDWPEVTKYRALVSAQEHRVEIIQDLYKSSGDPAKGIVHGGLIIDHLKAFYKSTRTKPGRIIFYRDGVSEGQFSQVLLHEMDAIRKACQALEPDYLPRVTFVVVQKRHHTRLFPNNHNDRNSTDKSGNILPGTVIDTKICHPSEFDFYLCSHAGIQGTSRPAHYHVLYDENGFDADHIQALTNSLCYTYARCTRSVSIVPPAYYAHLAAFRARYYIEGTYSDSGSTSAGGGETREGNHVVRHLPVIKDNVKEVMFYC